MADQELEVLNRDVYESKSNKVFLGDDGNLRQLAERVMKSNQGRLKYCNLDQIEFAVVEGDKGDFLAKAIKIAPLYRLFMQGKKFIVLFNSTMIEHTAPGSHDKVMLHELGHCNTEYDEIIDHDTQDFSWMLKEYGFDWKNNDKHIIPPEELRKLCPWGMPGSPQTASGRDLEKPVEARGK